MRGGPRQRRRRPVAERGAAYEEDHRQAPRLYGAAGLPLLCRDSQASFYFP